ncbi:MAG TPA: HD domain-containing protein [Candidatus Eisenbacteria bacterium]|nr:HD domain-containing protein [Candidatus Eisenbacteria bacterium]
MTVPSRSEAASLLLSLGPPAWHVRHSRAVGEVAGWLAAAAERAGRPIDRGLVEAAALLHDVDKILPKDDPARRLGHGFGSAAWLARRGHPELEAAVASHSVTRLATAEAERWLATATPEERIVAYADKRARQRLVSMAARFAHWARRRDALSPALGGTVWLRAQRLEADVCAFAGTRPEAVGRLRWTGRALAAARATRPGNR